MPIEIANYLLASLHLTQSSKFWNTIVILDSGRTITNFLQEQALTQLVLSFDDIEEPRPNKRLPSLSQIEEALDFANGKDPLLVSCRAGRGRSVALAYLVACQAHGDREAVKLLNPTRHRPNRYIVQLGASILNSMPVLATFDEWHREHSHIQLADYYDEAEKEFEALEAQGATNLLCK
jgi:predicted protein tyrosine phosphatase